MLVSSLMNRSKAKEHKTQQDHIRNFKEWAQSLGCPETPSDESLKKLFAPHMRDQLCHIINNVEKAEKVRVWRKQDLAEFMEAQHCPRAISVKLSTVTEFYMYAKKVAQVAKLHHKQDMLRNLLEKVKEKEKNYHHLLNEYKSLQRSNKMKRENSFKIMALEKSLNLSVEELASMNKDLDSTFSSNKLYSSEEEMKKALSEKLGEKLVSGCIDSKEVKNLIQEIIFSFPVCDVYQELANRFRHELDLGVPMKDVKGPQKDESWVSEMEAIDIMEDKNLTDLENTLKKEESEEAELWVHITDLLSQDPECKDLLGDLKKSLLGKETQHAQHEGIVEHNHSDQIVLFNEDLFKTLDDLREKEVEYKKEFVKCKRISNLREYIEGCKKYFNLEIPSPEIDSTVLKMLEFPGTEGFRAPSAETTINLEHNITNGIVSMTPLEFVPYNISPLGLVLWLLKSIDRYKELEMYSLLHPVQRAQLWPTKFQPPIDKSSIDISLKSLDKKLSLLSSRLKINKRTVSFWVDQSICRFIPKGLLTNDGRDFKEVWKEIVQSSQSIKKLEEINKL